VAGGAPYVSSAPSPRDAPDKATALRSTKAGDAVAIDGKREPGTL